MPYKIPNTFNAKTPLGQSVQNLMTSYFGSLPTPEDTAKADYMNSTAEASRASAALNKQKYDANANAQAVYDALINNPDGLSPEETMKKNLAAYLANQQQSGNLATAGKTILAFAPWQGGNTPATINKAQLGSGMATDNTIEGTLQKERFANQRENMRSARQDEIIAPVIGGERPILPQVSASEDVNSTMPNLSPQTQELVSRYQEAIRSGQLKPAESMRKMLDMQPDYVAARESAKKDAALNIELKKAAPQAKSALQQTAQEAARQIDLVDRIIKQTRNGNSATGVIDARMPTFWQSTADLEANIDKLDANTFLTGLAMLKATTPAGTTGLGQITETEGEKIQKGGFNFDKLQGDKQFNAELGRYKTAVTQSLQNVVDKFNETYGTAYTVEDLIASASQNGQSSSPNNTVSYKDYFK